MPRGITLNSKELLEEMKRRGPQILKELGSDIKNSLDNSKKKYFNEFSGEMEAETKLSSNDDSIDINTNAIGLGYDTGNWDHPDVKAEMKKKKESGYYRQYSKLRKRLKNKSKIKGKKRIPFIFNSIWKGAKEFKKRLTNVA